MIYNFTSLGSCRSATELRPHCPEHSGAGIQTARISHLIETGMLRAAVEADHRNELIAEICSRATECGIAKLYRETLLSMRIGAPRFAARKRPATSPRVVATSGLGAPLDPVPGGVRVETFSIFGTYEPSVGHPAPCLLVLLLAGGACYSPALCGVPSKFVRRVHAISPYRLAALCQEFDTVPTRVCPKGSAKSVN